MIDSIFFMSFHPFEIFSISRTVNIARIIIYDCVIRVINNIERSPFDYLPEFPHDRLSAEISKIRGVFAFLDTYSEILLIYHLNREWLRGLFRKLAGEWRS